jgi:hypothetical protein
LTNDGGSGVKRSSVARFTMDDLGTVLQSKMEVTTVLVCETASEKKVHVCRQGLTKGKVERSRVTVIV